MDREEEAWDNEDEPPQIPASESEAVQMAVQELLSFLKVTADIDVQRGESSFLVDISAADPNLLVDDNAEVLQAIEYLVPRLVRGWIGQGVPVKIDYEGYRASREERLRDLAYDMADQVRDEEESLLLEPMNPADRRLIHMALAEDPDVETESEGDGFFKRVRIYPVEEYIEG